MAESGDRLARRLVELARRLRRAGLALGPGDTLLGLRAVAAVGVADQSRVAAALRACWCRSVADLAVFDRTFADWSGRGAAALAVPAATPADRAGTRLHLAAEGDGAGADRPEGPRRRGHRLVPSTDPGLASVDFARCTPAELKELLRVVGTIAARSPERPGRRRRPAGRGRLVDWRRSQRAALRTGGEWLQLARCRPRPSHRPVVVLCDTSGSMERYTRVLLRFCHALGRGPGRVEVFVFSTRLRRITRQLRERDPSRALEAVGRGAGGWAGGTRIGDSLHELLTLWGARVLSRSPITIVVSDGWETGQPERLGTALQRLRRSSRRLVWCNPLMGDPGFAPVTAGMRAALPHVDDLRPVHTLQSLAQLATTLGEADGRGRARPGHVSGSARPRRAGPGADGRRPGR